MSRWASRALSGLAGYGKPVPIRSGRRPSHGNDAVAGLPHSSQCCRGHAALAAISLTLSASFQAGSGLFLFFVLSQNVFLGGRRLQFFLGAGVLVFDGRVSFRAGVKKFTFSLESSSFSWALSVSGNAFNFSSISEILSFLKNDK